MMTQQKSYPTRRLNQILATGSVAAALFLGACTTNVSPGSYDANAVGSVQRAERGEIESYRYVEIRTERGVATASGVVAGAAAGSTVGSGAEGVLGALGGALIGGLIGKSIDEDIGRKTGYEYVIRTESGHLVTIVQASENPIPEGAPVLIVYGRDMTRITLDESRIEYDAGPDERTIGAAQDDDEPYYGRISRFETRQDSSSSERQ